MSSEHTAHRLILGVESWQASSNAPFLTPQEQELIIRSDAAFSAKVRRTAQEKFGETLLHPADEQSPTLVDTFTTDTRTVFGEDFAQGIVMATYSVDAVRSYRRYMLGQQLVPIEQAETPEEVRVRAADAVYGTLTGFIHDHRKPKTQEVNMALAGDLAYEVLGNNKAISTRLLDVTGKDCVKRINTWAFQYVSVTRGLAYASRRTETNLYRFQNNVRPESFKNMPNILEVIQVKKAAFIKQTARATGKRGKHVA